MNLILVALGGALGAVCRYGISLLPCKVNYPILTLVTNICGAILIGFIVGISMNRGWSSQWVLFWKTGVCGGFTTFSTFSLESMQLLDEGRYLAGGSYMGLSLVCCMVGVILGQRIADCM